MKLQHLNLSRRISLLLLLITAPLRPAPIKAEADPFTDWNWPMGMGRTSFRDFLNNGSPLPKIETEEIVPEFDNALAVQPFNFPLLPMPLNRHWSHWHQRYNKHLKELQVHQTWVADLQSPADVSVPKLKRSHRILPPNSDDAYSPEKTKKYHKFKRGQSEYKGPLYRPSISAGVMTNLGDFFNQLKANVQFAEHSQQLGEGESQLLEGLHPVPPEDSSRADDTDYESGQPSDLNSSKMLQHVRSYRPSQKIRSLVSRNPNGYRGSQFIDPSYMWLGLGK